MVYKELWHIVNAISPTARKRPDKLKLYNSAEEDSKVETGPENGLFWLRRLDRYPSISTILNFQCETASEVLLQEIGSMLNLDTFSWQESLCQLYIYLKETWKKKKKSSAWGQFLKSLGTSKAEKLFSFTYM